MDGDPTSSVGDDKEPISTGDPGPAAPSLLDTKSPQKPHESENDRPSENGAVSTRTPDPQTSVPTQNDDGGAANEATDTEAQKKLQPENLVLAQLVPSQMDGDPPSSVGEPGPAAPSLLDIESPQNPHDRAVSRAANEAEKLQPENLLAQLVSEIRTIRDRLDKLLEHYGQFVQGRESPQTMSKKMQLVQGSQKEATEPPISKMRGKKLPWCKYFDYCLVILVTLLACCVAWYSESKKLGTFDIEGFFMKNPEIASQWERLDGRAIRILVTGKTGTGKSALINGLIGRNVTKEGDTLDPTTARVEQIKQMVHGISMSVFDSPGLQDGTSREHEYLQDMQRKCEKVDLVLYAIKMTDQRVHAADTKAMKKITDAFGHKFWEKAIFVMTFANEVRSPEYPDDEYENEIYFEKRLQDWKEKLPSFIEQRSDIPIKIGKHVPIVPAGYYKIRDLPGRKFWFSQFWKAALDRMMESSAEGAGYMLQFSKDRLKNYNDTSKEDFQKPIHEQPILSKIVDE